VVFLPGVPFPENLSRFGPSELSVVDVIPVRRSINAQFLCNGLLLLASDPLVLVWDYGPAPPYAIPQMEPYADYIGVFTISL
jgi:hypothetical protein